MKTQLPASINTIDEAKAFLTDLYNNGEAYHPEDSADSIEWALPVDQQPTVAECVQLDKLMADIYSLPGNDSVHNMAFDPCRFILDLEFPEPAIDISHTDTMIKSVATENTGGNVFNDVIVLKCGTVIRISDGMVRVLASDNEDTKPLAEAFLQ